MIAVGAGNGAGDRHQRHVATGSERPNYIPGHGPARSDDSCAAATLDAIATIRPNPAFVTRVASTMAVQDTHHGGQPLAGAGRRPRDEANFPAADAGVFPPVGQPAATVPWLLPQTYESAPAAALSGPHPTPGGLPIPWRSIFDAISLATTIAAPMASNQSVLSEGTPVMLRRQARRPEIMIGSGTSSSLGPDSGTTGPITSVFNDRLR